MSYGIQERIAFAPTPDLKASIDFYTRLPGFTLFDSCNEWGWASLNRDNFGIMLTSLNSPGSLE